MIKVTKKQASELFETNQFFMLLARLCEHEYWLHHKDYPLSAAINNHSRRIRESAERIQLETNFILKIKNKEVMDNHVHELGRLLKSYLNANTNQLKAFNDSIEEQLKYGTTINEI